MFPQKELIRLPNFLVLNGTSYSFEMKNYLNEELVLEESLTKICETISKAGKEHCSNNVWTKLPEKGCCGLLVLKSDDLYQFLDVKAIEENDYNFVIFENVDHDGITVIHFGPIWKGKCQGTFTEQVEKANHELVILEDILEKLRSPENMDESNNAKPDVEYIISQILAKHHEPLKAVETETELKKQELIDLTEKVYSDTLAKENVHKLIGKINMSASTGKIVLKGITAILFAEVAEELAKKFGLSAAAKAATKVGGRMGTAGGTKLVAKAMPFMGLAVGTVFGAWRVWQGDLSGAGMEIVSGAAACMPGSGTTASLAIDALIVAKDISEAKDPSTENLEKLDAEIKNIELDLNELSDRYELALVEYELVSGVLEHAGFLVESLAQEYQTRSKILAAIRRPLTTLQGLPVTYMDNSVPQEFEDSMTNDMCFVIV